MAAIKRFFEKRKLDIKFKQAGRGHSVADDKKQNAPSTSFFGSKEPKVTQHVQSSSQQRAAEAALTRMTATSSKGTHWNYFGSTCYNAPNSYSIY